MEVDKDLLNKINSIIDIKNYETVFVCSEATLFEKKQSKVIMLVTDYCFYLLKKSSKTYVTICEIQWHNLSKITYVDKTTFSFTSHSDTYKVGYEKAEELLKKLFDYLENTLVRIEKPEYVNCESIMPPMQHIPTAFIQRFKYKLRCANISECSDILIKELTKIARRKTELDITSLPSADQYAGILLDCCQIEPTIKSVILPQGIKRNYWKELADCLRINTTINGIKTNDAMTDDFADIAKALSKNKHSSLVQFSFSRSNINSHFFKYILKMLQTISFNKLSFENAITARDFYDLMDYKGIAFAMTSLQSLSFKEIKNLSVKNFLEQLPSLREITLVNSDTNLDELFAVIPSLNLEVIHVNGGHASSRLNTNIELPSTLYSISFEKIKWNGNTMNRTWDLCINHLSRDDLALKECCQKPRINLENKKLKEKEMVLLSFAFAQLTDDQWSDFFMSVNMKVACRSLAQLNWSGNPFGPEILHFMMHCSNLHILIADGCFSPDCPGIQDFTDFLNKFNRIKILSIRGTDEIKLSVASQIMFPNLKNNKSLVELDVCDNDLEDDGLADLGKLLMKNKNIKKIRFENNDIQSGTAYYSFFEMLKTRGTKLDILYPDKEIYSMHKAKILDGKSVNYILQCYEAITNENEDFDSSDDDSSEDDGSDIFVAGVDANKDILQKVSESPAVSKKGSSDFSTLQNEWTLTIPPTNLPETAQQMNTIDQTYNLSALIQRVRSV